MKLAQDETGYILVGDSHPTEAFFQSAPALEAYELALETVNGFLTSVNRGEKVTCCEVVVGEYRFKVCVGMPDHIIAYMDYVEPQMEPVAKEVPMQYINRRETMPDGVTRGDMALWPTMFPITSPGWVQISAHPIDRRHEVGDTVLIYDRFPKPERDMERGTVINTLHRPDNRTWVKFENAFEDAIADECVINFSKGDHLSHDDIQAWHEDATGHQESYYESFNRNQ